MTNTIIGKEYLIIKEIGKGSTSIIYLVQSIITQEKYAAKVYKTHSEYFLKEVDILKKLSLYNFKGIIHLISYGEEPIVNEETNDEEENNNQQYIILDYIPNNDLFYHVKKSKGLNENEAKYIFYKIVKAVQQCHINGICHRDLKLENILLDNNNNPIICDFGFGCSIEEEDIEVKLSQYLGTDCYEPPEILDHVPYNGIKCDIFCLRVILFCTIFCCFPFANATNNDKLYKLIINKKYKEFWKEIGKKIGKEKINKVSLEFKNLFFKMVSNDPDERPSAGDILNDNWLKDINNAKTN